MNKIDAVKVLMAQIGDEAELNEAVKIGITAILDTLTVKAPPKAAQPKADKPAGRRKKAFDVGKAMACHKAGWSVAKIADEMGVSQQTVYKYLKEAEDNDKTKDTM